MVSVTSILLAKLLDLPKLVSSVRCHFGGESTNEKGLEDNNYMLLEMIFVPGFFALLKILTMSAGPLLLNSFILVALGGASFKYEGYEPIQSIPDITRVFIQAKVAFAHMKFLESPELQSANVKQNMENVNHAILIESANFAWEENYLKPTLWNINLEMGKSYVLLLIIDYSAGSEKLAEIASPKRHETPSEEIKKGYIEKQLEASKGDQLIKQEEREVGDAGLKLYMQYLNQNTDLFLHFMASLSHLYMCNCLIFAVVVTINAYASFGILAVVTWQVLFVFITVIYMAIRLQVLGKCQLQEAVQEKEQGPGFFRKVC
ncbi:hypothetical protein QYF36_005130 [Acer negundo]|nr:hypothetical protein QYF36_005130 [Acer negundo]